MSPFEPRSLVRFEDTLSKKTDIGARNDPQKWRIFSAGTFAALLLLEHVAPPFAWRQMRVWPGRFGDGFTATGGFDEDVNV